MNPIEPIMLVLRLLKNLIVTLNYLMAYCLVCRPVALELSARQLERSGSLQGQLQTSPEDAFIYTVLKHLEYQRCFRTIRSTNLCCLLTYLLTYEQLSFAIKFVRTKTKQTHNNVLYYYELLPFCGE